MRKSLEGVQDKEKSEEKAKSLSKMEIIRAYYEKRRQELWCRALGKSSFEEAVKGESGDVSVSTLRQGKFNL